VDVIAIRHSQKSLRLKLSILRMPSLPLDTQPKVETKAPKVNYR